MAIGTLAMIGAGIKGINSALSGAVQNKRWKQSHERSKELMGIQYENQKKLNQQGQALQMQTWKDTNYPAQMKMLKEAGLSPGLMYGQGGTGGATTGSQTGGSASSGQSHAPMDIQSLLNAQMMQSQIKVNNSIAKKNEAEADATSGYKATESGAITDKLKAELGKITSEIKVNSSVVLKNKSEADRNRSVIKLNDNIAKLNDQKVKESIVNTELTQMDINWMRETGINRNAPIVGKTVKYLSNKTGLSEKEVIGLVGGAIGLERLLNALGGKFIGNLVEKMTKGGKIGF